MNDEEELDTLVRNTLARSRRPPVPPVDEMWANIEKRAFNGPRVIPLYAGRSDRWRVPALAAAAALIFGTALGWSIAPRTSVTMVAATAAPVAAARVTASPIAPASTDRAPEPVSEHTSERVAAALPSAPRQDNGRATNSLTLVSAPAGSASPLDVAESGSGSDMVRYLAQTSVLLASLPADHSSTACDTAIAARASDLLTQTHLLLDSRAGSDPTLHRLLEDLELVLAQVARLRGRGSSADLQLIHQALTVHDVIPRVHDATLEASTTD